MPVETGMTSDESVLDDTGTVAVVPPAEVASVDVLSAEQAAAEAGPATIEVRGRTFKLRSKVPGMLVMQMSKAQSDLQGSGATDPVRQASALGKISDALTKLVAVEDRTDFIEHCEDVDPPMDMPELMEFVGKMMEAITGRPS